MNIQRIQYKMMKRAEEELSFSDAMKSYDKRLMQYGKEVTTDSEGSMKHRHMQSLGMITAALMGGTGGAILGGALAGPNGAAAGAGLGTVLGHAANVIGQLHGTAKPPRNKEEQMEYTNSPDGFISELLIPGYAGYQRGRTERHIFDTVGREFDKKMKVKTT